MSAVDTIIVALVMAVYVAVVTLLVLPWQKWKRERARETLHLLVEVGRQIRDERRTVASVAVGEALMRLREVRENDGDAR